MYNVTFEAETHTYRLDGVVVPSVTQIIQAAGLSGLENVNPDLLERNAAFGNAVHKAVELQCRGTLDIGSVDDPVKPYLKAWGKFVADFNYVSFEQEFRGVDKAIRVGFTIDNIGYINGQTVIIDLKTGTMKSSDIIQSCAYGKLYPTKRIMLVYLKEEDYKSLEIKGADRRKGESIFMNCLSIYNYKKQEGLL